MLQPQRPLTVIGGGKPTPSEIASPADFLESFTGFIRRQFPIVVLAVVVSVALGVTYLLTTPPMYSAQLSMIIDTHKFQRFQKQEAPVDNSVDSAMVDSEVEILRSENIALAVIKQFHLADDPEFTGPGSGLAGAFVGTVSGLFGHGTPKTEYERTRRAAAVFAERLAVKRVGFSYIIQISFESLDPQRAADIADAVAGAYIADQLEAKVQVTRQAGTWLQERLRELREEASTAQRAVVEFKAKNNIVSTGGPDKRLVDQQQVSELNSQMVIARAQASESQARLDRIEAVLSADSPDASVDATVTDTLKNDVITKLRSQYLEVAAREANWAERYGRTHLAVVNLRNQMSELRNSILDELRRIAESYKSDYAIAKQRQASIERELAQAVAQTQVTNRAEVQLSELQSNAESYRALYDDFLQRYMETVQQQSFPITEARVVTPAARPLTKSRPKGFLVLLLATAGGMVLGLGVGHLRDLSDRVFRTRVQIEAALGKDCLATVPNIKPEKPKAERWLSKNLAIISKFEVIEKLEEADLTEPRLTEPNPAEPAPAAQEPAAETQEPPSVSAAETVGEAREPRVIVRRDPLLWQVVDAPLSPFAESIRSIKMATYLYGAAKTNKPRKANRILGVTSSLPGEGKSTVAASLAQLMSHSGRRVILVDCDLRAPRLTRTMAPDARVGLLEVASGDASLDEAIWTDKSTNLNFLPVVAPPHLHLTADILGADDMRALFENLRRRYDYVIADFAPLVPNVDVRATKGLVDYYVFVVEWGRTKTDLVERALKEAAGIYEDVLGVVLNKVDTGGLRRHEGYGRYDQYKYYNRES